MAKASNQFNQAAFRNLNRKQRPTSTSVSKRKNDELNSDIALVHTFGQIQLGLKATVAQPYNYQDASNAQQAFKFMHAERSFHDKNRSSAHFPQKKDEINRNNRTQSNNKKATITAQRSANNRTVSTFSRQYSTITHEDQATTRDDFLHQQHQQSNRNHQGGIVVQKGRQSFQRQLKTFKLERDSTFGTEPTSALLNHNESPTMLSRQDSQYRGDNRQQHSLKPLTYPKTTIVFNVSSQKKVGGVQWKGAAPVQHQHQQRPQTGCVKRSQNAMTSQSPSGGNNRFNENKHHSRQVAHNFLRNSKSSEDLITQASCQVNFDDAYGVNEDGGVGNGLYQHRFGDGSIAIDSSFINQASPNGKTEQRMRQSTGGGGINQFETKRLDNPFGCVLAQRTGTVMKPKSVYQRRKEGNTRVLQFEGKRQQTQGDKLARKVNLRSSFASRASAQQANGSQSKIACRNPLSIMSSFETIPNQTHQQKKVVVIRDTTGNVNNSTKKVVNHRSLLSHRPPHVSGEMYRDQDHSRGTSKVTFSPSKQQQQNFALYDSKSYASLHSSDNYLKKNSISLVALRNLHGVTFCDTPPREAAQHDIAESNQPISPMSPKMIEQQIQTMTEASLGELDGVTSGRAIESAADIFFVNGATVSKSIAARKSSKDTSANRYSYKSKPQSQVSRSKIDQSVNVSAPSASIDQQQVVVGYPTTQRQQEMFKMVIRASNQGRLSNEVSTSGGNLNYVTVKRPESSSSPLRKSAQRRNTQTHNNGLLQIKGDQKAIIQGRYLDSVPSTVKSNSNLLNVQVWSQDAQPVTEVLMTQDAETLPDNGQWKLKRADDLYTTLDQMPRRRTSHSPAANINKHGPNSASRPGPRIPSRGSQERKSTISIQPERAASRNINAFSEEDEGMTLALHESTKDLVGPIKVSNSVRSVLPTRYSKDGTVSSKILIVQNGKEQIAQKNYAKDQRNQNKRTSNIPETVSGISFEQIQIAPLPAATAYNFIKQHQRPKASVFTQQKQQRKAIQVTTHVFGQDQDFSSVEVSRPQSRSHTQLKSIYTHKRQHRRGQSGNRQKRVAGGGAAAMQSSVETRESFEQEEGEEGGRKTLLTLPKTQDSIPHSQLASTANISMKDLGVIQDSQKDASIDKHLLIQPNLDDEEDPSVSLDDEQQPEGVADSDKQNREDTPKHTGVEILISNQPFVPTLEEAGQNNLKSITDLNIVSHRSPSVALIVADNSTLALLDHTTIQAYHDQQRQQKWEAAPPRKNLRRNKHLRQRSQTMGVVEQSKKPRKPAEHNQDKIKMFQSILRQNQFPSAYKKKQI